MPRGASPTHYFERAIGPLCLYRAMCELEDMNALVSDKRSWMHEQLS
jgi:hypothetical protein